MTVLFNLFSLLRASYSVYGSSKAFICLEKKLRETKQISKHILSLKDLRKRRKFCIIELNLDSVL